MAYVTPEKKLKAIRAYYEARKSDPAFLAGRTRISVIANRKKNTGWTNEAFEEAAASQHGICAIEGCDRALSDADHIEYRGEKHPRELLCHPCNIRLSHYDSPRSGFVAYVKKHRDRILGSEGNDPLLLEYGI